MQQGERPKPEGGKSAPETSGRPVPELFRKLCFPLFARTIISYDETFHIALCCASRPGRRPGPGERPHPPHGGRSLRHAPRRRSPQPRCVGPYHRLPAQDEHRRRRAPQRRAGAADRDSLCLDRRLRLPPSGESGLGLLAVDQRPAGGRDRRSADTRRVRHHALHPPGRQRLQAVARSAAPTRPTHRIPRVPNRSPTATSTTRTNVRSATSRSLWFPTPWAATSRCSI